MPLGRAFDGGFNNGFGRDKQGELVLIVGNQTDYEDGDIMHAYNERAALCNWAEKYCHVKRMAGGRGVERPYQSLAWHMQEQFYQYKIVRTSTNQATRINIDPNSPDYGTSKVVREPLYRIQVTGFEQEDHYGFSRQEALESYLSSVGAIGWYIVKADNQWQVWDDGAQSVPYTISVVDKEIMHVDLFFQRRLKHERHRVFLDDLGRQVYFGGRQDRGETTTQAVWDEIENQDPPLLHRGASDIGRLNHRFIAHNTAMRKKYLILPVDDFTDTRAGELESPLLDLSDPENPVTVKRRKNWIDWRNMQELSPAQRAQISNPGKPVNLTGSVRTSEKIRTKEKTV